MGQQLVNQYLNDLDRFKKISGSLTEGVISEAFKDLLKAWARQANLHFINQYPFQSAQKTRIQPDGTILLDLLARVTRVSVETMAVSEKMKKAKRD